MAIQQHQQVIHQLINHLNNIKHVNPQAYENNNNFLKQIQNSQAGGHNFQDKKQYLIQQNSHRAQEMMVDKRVNYAPIMSFNSRAQNEQRQLQSINSQISHQQNAVAIALANQAIYRQFRNRIIQKQAQHGIRQISSNGHSNQATLDQHRHQQQPKQQLSVVRYNNSSNRKQTTPQKQQSFVIPFKQSKKPLLSPSQKLEVGQSQQLIEAAENLMHSDKQLYMQNLQKQNDDYYEFLDYLHKQQEEQAKDSMFAHSKKQKELLKAKEFSQQQEKLVPQLVTKELQRNQQSRSQSGQRQQKLIVLNNDHQSTQSSSGKDQQLSSIEAANKKDDQNAEEKLSKVSEESEHVVDQNMQDHQCESDGEEEQIDEDEDNDEDNDEDEDDMINEQEAHEVEQKTVKRQVAYKKYIPKGEFKEEIPPKEKKPAVPRAPWRQKKEEKEKAKQDNAEKPKKKNNKILASMPANWEEEEQKFFESNYEYNPQFVYESPATNKRFLKMFPAPRYDYMPQAKKIIDQFLETYGSESKYFETEGKVMHDREGCEQAIWDYLDELGPSVRAVAKINFSTKNVAATSVTYDNWSSKIRINVQLPIQYREGRMKGVLHHEIGSHFLRRFNEVQQPWNNKRKEWGIKSTVMIEEGSGCINMMLEQSKDPKKFTYLFKPALNYYMCCKASEMSFSELFKDLEKYVDNPKHRYKYVLRVKRGLSDTSQPGGLYKDQVYLEGAMKLLELRKEIDWQAFYSAKLNLEDLKRQKIMKALKRDDGIVIPKFVENVDEYVKCLDVIAKHNFIE